MNNINKLVKILPNIVENFDEKLITKKTHFIDDLYLDSIGMITLILLCEESWNIQLSEKVTDIAQVETVEKLLNIIECDRKNG